MLKFSGFADLTSCQDNGAKPRKPTTGSEATNGQATDNSPSGVLLVGCRQRPNALNASRARREHLGAQTRAADTKRLPRPAIRQGKPVSSMKPK